MIVSHIAAIDKNGVIGLNNSIPWHIPGELKHFKKLTLGHTLILGRKTFQTLPSELKNRRIIVLSKKNFSAASIECAQSIKAALKMCQNEEEVFIAGGGEIYRQTMPVADRLYLSHIEAEYTGDTWYPSFEENQYTKTHLHEEDSTPPFSAFLYKKNLRPYSHVLSEYLQETEEINYTHQLVIQKSDQLERESENTQDFISKAFLLVRNSIPHSADIEAKHVSITASDVLQNNEGMCYAKSLLLAALLRAKNILCGFCYQKLRLDGSSDSKLIIHALNAVYVEESGSWIALDARGTTDPGLSADLLQKGYYEFSPDISLGEVNFNTVFPNPDPATINALKISNSFEELYYSNLPSELSVISLDENK